MSSLPDRIPLRRRCLPLVLRGMRNLERIIIGLWVAFAAAAVSVFASTIPYIYAEEDNIRCGAIALTTASLSLMSGGLLTIPLLVIIFEISRLLIRSGSTRRLGFLLVPGGMLWSSAFIAGFLVFANYVYIVENSLAGAPPKLPDNKNDQVACKNLILQSRPHDLVSDYLERWATVPNHPPLIATSPGGH
jgi:hypothetical protein